MRIVDLVDAGKPAQLAAARMLHEAFAPRSWETLEEADEEVDECLQDGLLCRAALDGNGQVLGWLGARPQYDGRVWEVHPVVVAAGHRRSGIGRALLIDIEQQVAQRGGMTLLLGADDDTFSTSLSQGDLFVEPWRHMRDVRNVSQHPFEFYQKCGFVIVGVVPDANGPGMPDIIMAKRVTAR